MKYLLSLFLCLGVPFFSSVLSQAPSNDRPVASKESEGWDVADPPLERKSFTFDVSRGTWMNVDVHPGGTEIVFDLLGDIYTLPISGGKATLIAGGLPFEVQPRYSPDGKQILFTSDRGGGDNVWVMDKDGKNKRQITKESFRLLNNAVWTPGGEYIIARKHFTSTRSLGAGEMWMYHVAGGKGIQLTKRKNDQQDAGEPFVSPDGRYVYFSEDMSPGPYFQYNKDPNGYIYMIRRYDRQSGKVENITGGAGSAFRPTISPNGELLAFGRRVREKTVLFLHDLNTGEEWPIYDGLSKDQAETWAIFGVYPNFSWTPTGNSIVFWSKGKLHQINISTRRVKDIPFTVSMSHEIIEAKSFRQEVGEREFEAKMIRDAVTSPDGKYVAFNAAGKIYLKKLPDGTPKRLTANSNLEFQPAFSPDGKEIAYICWSDTAKGAVCKIAVNDVGRSGKKLTPEKGIYLDPSFSSDGKKILFEKGRGNNLLGYTFTKEPGIYSIWAKGSNIVKVHDEGSQPIYNKDGTKIYYQRGGGSKKEYVEFDLGTQKKRVLFTAKYANQFVPSPDGKWLAFTELFNVYVIPFPNLGKPFELSAKTESIPVRQVSKDAGTSLHWSADSKKLHWVLGPQYFTHKIEEAFDFVMGAKKEIAPVDAVGIPLGLTLKTDIPEGKLALTNARIITMDRDRVIKNGYVLINGNKIEAIGEGKVAFGKNVKEVDCAGKTIIPGLIDVHAHMGVSYNGLSPHQSWPYMANLAYGITTTHDPSNDTEMVFSQSEMVRSGVMLGPRIYSTGTILYGAEGDFKAVINRYDDALSHLRRLKAVGAFSVKSYNQPRREQRQQIIAAAQELDMMVFPEGGSMFYHNMSMILDGHPGIEHSIPVNPFYEDVVLLWGNSKTAYTPTLIVGYGGRWGEDYFYQKTHVWEKEPLLSFTPRFVIDSRSRRRVMLPERDWELGFVENARGCKRLANVGTKVQLGAHGQLQGLGAHWELWMLSKGGMSEMDALRAGTQHGADYLGMGHALGSITVGKLADMVILNGNPLTDIYNTEKVHYVMKNGRLYESATLNEIGNYNKKRLPMYWEHAKGADIFNWHQSGPTLEHIGGHCGCVH